MKPRAVGIVAGGGGPFGSASLLQDMIGLCQKKYGSSRSYEYPPFTYFSFPYSETMLVNHNQSATPSRELSYCIQQLKNIGMEIIVIPCFTICSYLTFRNYGRELIEVGQIVQQHLKKNQIANPLVLCSARTRKSRYCDLHFDCRYPDDAIQNEVTQLMEEAMQGKKIDIRPLLDKLPDMPIVTAAITLNAQLLVEPDDPRLINPNKILAEHVVKRSFEGTFEEQVPCCCDKFSEKIQEFNFIS